MESNTNELGFPLCSVMNINKMNGSQIQTWPSQWTLAWWISLSSMLCVIKALEAMILSFSMQMDILWCHGYADGISNQKLGRNEMGREKFWLWQRVMDPIFHDFIETFMQVYIDDIVIKSSSKDGHIDHLR